MKKIVILITVFALLLTSVVYGAGKSFTDVKEADWFYKVLNGVVERGIIDGYPDGTFKPQNNITRAEFTKVIIFALELDIVEGNAFVDTEEHWAKDIINTAVENHIIDRSEYGYSYVPDEKITRIEMAKMIVRALGFEKDAKSKAGEKTKFLDNITIKDTDKGYVIIASDNGIINGYPNNTFQPNGKATRAEAAQMLMNALNYKIVEEAKTEEGYIDTSKLPTKSFEEYGFPESLKDTLTLVNRVTGEIMSEPDELIVISKDSMPMKFADLIIEDYYYVAYDDSILPEVKSVYWGVGARSDLFIIEGTTVGVVDINDYAADFLDGDGIIVGWMRQVNPCYRFSTTDAGTQIVVKEYPNMPGLDGKVGANKKFTFVFVGLEKHMNDLETVIFKNTGLNNGSKTDDVLVIEYK